MSFTDHLFLAQKCHCINTFKYLYSLLINCNVKIIFSFMTWSIINKSVKITIHYLKFKGNPSKMQFLVLVQIFRRKPRLINWVSMCLSVSVRMRACVCKILVPPNNFQTSYPIDTKFWLHNYSIVPGLSNAINPRFLILKTVPGRYFWN